MADNIVYGDGTAGPHALISLKDPNPSYQPSDQTISYTNFNKVSSISQLDENGDPINLTYTYGLDRQRIKTVFTRDAVIEKTKYFIGDYEEVTTSSGTKKYHYISDGTGLCAIFVIDDQDNDTLFYTLNDHLGSLAGVINTETDVVTYYSYDACSVKHGFCEVRTKTDVELIPRGTNREGNPRDNDDWTTKVSSELFADRGFTGHEHLIEFGLIDMNGRVYDPMLGRFLSPDPFVQLPGYADNFNRYSYALNNPLVYVDPDGEFLGIAIAIGAIIGAYIGGSAAEGWEMNPTKWEWDGDTWKGVGLGAVFGAAGGAGFYYAAPALAQTSFFANFGVSGTIGAFTVSGGVFGGAIGYTSGFSGGMLYSDGDWNYSYQSGIFGAKVGATVGSTLGAIAGVLTPEGRNWIADMFSPHPPIDIQIPRPEPETFPSPVGSNADALKIGSPFTNVGNLESNYHEPRSYYERALQYIGVPYSLGGLSYSGLDCSGLVCVATQSSFRWRTTSGNPPGSWNIMTYTHTRPGFLSTATIGDLLLWPGRHTAFYAGNGRLFHAHGNTGTPTGFTNDLFRWWIPNRGWPSLYRQLY